MASFSSYPFRYSIRDVFLHFRQSISTEAGIALEARDVAMRRDNAALLSENASLKSSNDDLHLRKLWLEEALGKARSITEAELAAKEKLEGEVALLKARRKEERNRVSEQLRKNDLLENEIKRLEEEVKRVSELEETIKALRREKVGMQAEIRKMRSKKSTEVVERVSVLEREKAELEELVCKGKREGERVLELERRNEVLVKQKGEAEEEVRRLRSAAKVSEFRRVSNERMAALGGERTELCRRIGVLEREKGEKDVEIGRVLDEKMGLEREKRVLEEEKEVMEAGLRKAVSEVRAENERILSEEAELRKENCELVERIEGLESVQKALEVEKRRLEEKGEEISEKAEMMEAEVDKAKKRAKEALDVYREKCNEIERILNEKNAMEDEGRERIERLEREKKEMEAEFCRVEKEKSEEILSILNEKMGLEAAKDTYAKKNFELVGRISVLEREKRGFEAEITGKHEVIKEMEKEINRLASKLSTPLQNEGQNAAGVVHSSEHIGTINHDINPCKRKRTIRKCEELGQKILKPASEHVGEVKVACEWEADQDLLNAFDVNPELCLKAVCALYRQHIRLPDSTNTSLSPGARGFKPEHSERAMTLAEYLIFEDPEGRKMKKLVAKLDKFNPLAVGVCTDIAKQHYKQVFEIYKKKEDPLFLS